MVKPCVRISLLVIVALGIGVIALPVWAADPVNREPVTLTISNIWGGTRIPLMESILRKFEEKYPWITVVNQVESSHNALEERVAVAIAAGSPPDVWMVDRARLGEFVEAGLLQPLDAFIADSGLDLSIFFPIEIEASRYKGQTYVLPTPGTSPVLLYYRRDLFAQAGFDPNRAPETFDELTEYALRLQRIDGDGNVIIGGADLRSWPRYKVAQLGYLNGAEVFSPDGLTANFTSPQMLHAARWMADFAQRVRYNGNIATGTLAMKTQGDWAYFYYKDQFLAGDMGIALIPHGPDGVSQSLVLAGWSFGIPVGVQHPYESYLLIEFLTTDPDAAKVFAMEQGRLSPVIEFATDPYYYNYPGWEVVVDSLLRAVHAPSTPVSRRIIDADGAAFSELFHGREAPDIVLIKLQEQVDGILAEYRASLNR